jgi:hypothetical protein
VLLAAALAAYLAASLARPLLAGKLLAGVLAALENPVVQGLAYVFALSLLAQQQLFASVATGLFGFVILRWGLLGRALRPLTDRLVERYYGLPAPDAVLRALLVRAAVRLGVAQPDADALTRSVSRALDRLPGR